MYERFLKNLLAPLGVYNLTEGSVNGAELHALGTGLDEIAALLDWTEREGLLTDAEDEGLRRRESPSHAGPPMSPPSRDGTPLPRCSGSPGTA